MRKNFIIRNFIIKYLIPTVAAIVSMTCIGIAVIGRDTAAGSGTQSGVITKSAAVSMGVAEQTFDLDISSPLQIEEVLVSAGQQVQKGTVLFRVTEDSVQSVRTALQREILDTSRDCDALEASQREVSILASQSCDSSAINAEYAGVLYRSRCDALQSKADKAREAVDEKQNQVNENLLQLTRAQQELADAREYLNKAQIAVSENYDSRYQNAYYYIVYEKTRENAENMVNQLEEQVEHLTERNESLLYEVDESLRTYHQIAQELEKEKLAARMDYDAGIHASQTAQEWYDIQMAGLDSALQEARGRYQTALQNIRQFDAYVAHNQVLCGYNGVLLDIMVEAGGTVCKNDILVRLYDQKAATINVLLHEEEYPAIDQEEPVEIVFAEVPDQIFEGRITKVTDQDYVVTVTIQGDISGLYDGMTGDVTFLKRSEKLQ